LSGRIIWSRQSGKEAKGGHVSEIPRIFAVQAPTQGVVLDVKPDAMKISIATDDMIVKSPLPD
jgi:hypothetical protein